MEPLLRVERLTTVFDPAAAGGRHSTAVPVAAVDQVSFDINAGETLGLVGESGSGKSVTALSIMRLVQPPGRIAGGRILFKGRDLLELDEPAMRAVRGAEISLIFQEPMTALNPVFRVGDQIAEALLVHGRASRQQARDKAIELLQAVRIPDPASRVRDYPHQLSGGMRQRVMIAIALACRPALVIADEPTTALDVTIQAQILDLIGNLREETGAAIILITHDLGVVAETCDEVLVMYTGEIVEQAPTRQLFVGPQHPYTVGLLGSLPRLGEKRERLSAIAGSVPSLTGAAFVGCRFADRCPFADAHCRAEAPPLRELVSGHWSRCWKAPLDRLAA
jgi:oligopeptide/dipeptide ABC transporter ATP-binding protein